MLEEGMDYDELAIAMKEAHMNYVLNDAVEIINSEGLVYFLEEIGTRVYNPREDWLIHQTLTALTYFSREFSDRTPVSKSLKPKI